MIVVMKRILVLWSVAVLSFCGVLALAAERATAPGILNVRLGAHQDGHTRIVLDLDDAAAYRVVPRAGDKIDIIIDNAAFVGSGPLPTDTGLVRALATNGGTVTASLGGPALPSRVFVLEPRDTVRHHRLVVDLEPASRGLYATAVSTAVANEQSRIAAVPALPPKTAPTRPLPQTTTPGPAPVPKPAPAQRAAEAKTAVKVAAAEKNTGPQPAPDAPLPRLKPAAPSEIMSEALAAAKAPADTGRSPFNPAHAATPGRAQLAYGAARPPTIVIDPGHGGRDPGAVGSTGLTEKTVTWKAAKVLKDELTARGYEVVLTRSGDTYVDLTQRIDIARAHQADMFLSIHADANPVPAARGASVYTLSKARTAQMVNEVASTGDFKLFDRDMSGEDRDLSKILVDIASDDTRSKSVELASTLIREMTGRVQMVNNTHRRAGLVVLLSPDVPAVLVELAFLSNAKDEANLSSKRWRRSTMTAVADGIDSYFGPNRPRQQRADLTDSVTTIGGVMAATAAAAVGP